MKLFIKIFAFILVALVAIGALTTASIVGIGNFGEIKSCANELYSLKENTMDVLYIGSSSTWAGVSPPVIYNETGIAGFNRSCTVQSSYTSYFYLLEALQYQSPKLLVLESETLFTDFNENFTRVAVDSMKNSDVKKEAIDFYSDISENPLFTKASYKMPYLYYNSSWSELKPEEVYIYYKSVNQDYNKLCPMGGRLNANVCTFEWNEETFATTDEVAGVNNLNETYFVKILELCKEKNIEVMVVTYPNATSSYAMHNKTQQLCDAHNVPHLNLRMDMKKIGIDPETDFSDEGEHTNITGTVKISRHLASVIKENYDLPDRRGTEEYKFYDEYLNTFLERNSQYLQ